MATRFERITYLGRNDFTLSLGEHVRELKEKRDISQQQKNKWYSDGLKTVGNLKTNVQEYYKDKDYWKSDISNDELLSQISMAGGHSRLLKIAGRRIAELLDEIEELKKPGPPR